MFSSQSISGAKLLAGAALGALVAGYAPSAYAEESTQTQPSDIVVTAAGFAQKITDAPASISVITAEELAKRPYITLIDAVRELEGVDVGETSDKSGQRSISFRGMGSDYTLLLINGKRQNNHGNIYPNDFGGNQFNHIPALDTIERIEVIRGPASTLYGADALGGVINIITKPVSSTWSGSATVGRSFQEDRQFGDDTTFDATLTGPIIQNVLGLSLRGSLYRRDASTPEFVAAIDPDGGEHARALGFGSGGKTVKNTNKTVGGTLSWSVNPNHTVDLDVDFSTQKYDNTPVVDAETGAIAYPLGTLDGLPSIWRAAATGMVQPRVGYTEDQVFERFNWSVSHRGDWGIGSSVVTLAYVETDNKGRTMPFSVAERQDLQALWNEVCVGGGFTAAAGATDGRCSGTNRGSYKAPTLDDLTPEQAARLDGFLPRALRTLKSSQYTLDARFNTPVENLYGSHNLVVGGQVILGELDDGVFGLEASEGGIQAVQDHKQWSLFAEDNWSPVDVLTITGGVRYDHHNMFGGRFSPRLYAVLNATPTVTVKGGVSTGFKTPQTTDLYDGIRGFGGQGTSPQIGNPDLKPETSVNTELAVYWDPAPHTGLNVTVFQNDFKDKIDSTLVPACALVNFVRPCANLGAYFDVLGLGETISVPFNVDEARIRGVEVAGRVRILDGLTLRANYTLTDSKKLTGAEKGQPLTAAAKHMGNATLNWDISDQFSTQLTGETRSQRFRGVDTVTQQELYYKSYTVLHLGAQYKLNQNITISGRINNLLDRDFTAYDTNFTQVGGEWTPSYVDHYNNKDKARSWWMSVNARF